MERKERYRNLYEGSQALGNARPAGTWLLGLTINTPLLPRRILYYIFFSYFTANLFLNFFTIQFFQPKSGDLA